MSKVYLSERGRFLAACLTLGVRSDVTPWEAWPILIHKIKTDKPSSDASHYSVGSSLYAFEIISGVDLGYDSDNPRSIQQCADRLLEQDERWRTHGEVPDCIELIEGESLRYPGNLGRSPWLLEVYQLCLTPWDWDMIGWRVFGETLIAAIAALTIAGIIGRPDILMSFGGAMLAGFSLVGAYFVLRDAVRAVSVLLWRATHPQRR